MRLKSVFLMFLFFVGAVILLVVVKDHKIASLERKLEQVAPPETIAVVIYQRDTVFVRQAYTVEVETEVHGDSVYIYKNLVGILEQPLFSLKVDVNSRLENFKFDVKYKPLKVYILFKNKVDLRKGFVVYTEPDVGKVEVDFGNYEPAKKSKSFGVNLGLGYSKQLGPFILSDVQWRKFAVGVVLKEQSYGFYVRRQIW